ncbi:Predicted arabinose efflux permease, MFS family [Nonomuraea solani]|uniref:Predicted arabinose efflux permease, MFS family n=1 Tax=Nonomuraea solani TaxID=1144553 RepID=A0A1H6EN09_9ACTN|nr:MFS transporter [Nonomuraea solani]SEG99227.1 Predicted arabinose efflux permease, MFS family [Nonomuraea solani]
MSSATYRNLLRAPGAAAFFLTAALGRVGIAMTSLGIVWLVYGATGSYAVSGLVTGGFAVAEALVGPQLARLIDRFGQTRVLPPALLAHAAAVGALLAAVHGDVPAWLMTASGALAGATIPQLGALSAARWATMLRGERAAELRTAFSLESLANATAFLAGPFLVSALGAAGYPTLGTLLAAALICSGGLALATQRRTAPAPESSAVERRRAGRSLVRPAFVVLVGLNVSIGLFFGASQVSTTAFTVQHGAADAAALIFAASSCSGLLTGWLYGLSRWRAASQVQLVVAVSGLALASTLPLTVGSPLGLGFVSVLTGGTIPPILVLLSVRAERTVHPAVLTQAFTWLNSACAAGSAAAAALSGWVADASGARYGFAVATSGAVVMAALALIGSRAKSPTP